METKRQIIHIGMAGFALLLGFLTRWQALACAAAAFAFNLFVMPRIARGTFRDEEKTRGYSTGMLSYCVSVFVLVLLFPAHIVAGAWAVMAFGDGFASLIGKHFGRARLGWNPSKSWAGFIAFIIAGSIGAFVFQTLILYWLDDYFTIFNAWRFYCGGLAVISAITAVTAATIESLDMKLNDNISVPLVSGVVLWFLHFSLFFTEWGAVYADRILPALAVSLAIGAISYAAKAVDVWGLLGGIAIGFAMYYFADWRGFAVLLAFFIAGTACTKIGRRIKEQRGVAQEHKGRRGLKNALANCGPGLLFAYIIGTGGSWDFLDGSLTQFHAIGAMALTGAFAAALADTMSSEIGQLSKAQPVMITTFRKATAGTNGAITLAGTIAGAAGAVIVSLAALAAGLVDARFVWIPITAGLIGTTVDSVLGAALEEKGLVNNEFVNFCCALSGGAFAFVIFWALLEPETLRFFLSVW
jgi:uncharacterized protein (TIGR00297 family)